jgi:hypothetical protein
LFTGLASGLIFALLFFVFEIVLVFSSFTLGTCSFCITSIGRNEFALSAQGLQQARFLSMLLSCDIEFRSARVTL